MSLIITTVDAFTDKPFAGNPAAVCVLEKPADEAWMRNVAAEMNLSETAFLRRRDDGFDLRWFTPAVEVDLCGHATLASAHVLWERGLLRPEAQAKFFTRSGVLTAARRGDLIELNFPAKPADPVETPPMLIEALGAPARFVGKSNFDYLVELESEATVRNVQPDHRALKRFGARGVIVTAKGETRGFDFVSRFFAPGSGIDEDPVTGSAHCTLGPYWQSRLGRSEFTAYQASPRGGVVHVRVNDNRVLLAGHAVTVLRAELLA